AAPCGQVARSLGASRYAAAVSRVIEAGAEPMEPAIPVMAVIGAIAVSVIVVRLATAFAKRLERRPPIVAPPDPAIGDLRDALDAMQERLDFLERALVAQRNQSGRALPAAGERADQPGETPS